MQTVGHYGNANVNAGLLLLFLAATLDRASQPNAKNVQKNKKQEERLLTGGQQRIV